jgi:hypothetical protein
MQNYSRWRCWSPNVTIHGPSGVQTIEDAGAILGLISNIPSKDVLTERLQICDRVRLIRAIIFQVGGVAAVYEKHPFFFSLLAKYEALDGKLKGLRSEEGWEWGFKYAALE